MQRQITLHDIRTKSGDFLNWHCNTHLPRNQVSPTQKITHCSLFRGVPECPRWLRSNFEVICDILRYCRLKIIPISCSADVNSYFSHNGVVSVTYMSNWEALFFLGFNVGKGTCLSSQQNYFRRMLVFKFTRSYQQFTWFITGPWKKNSKKNSVREALKELLKLPKNKKIYNTNRSTLLYY